MAADALRIAHAYTFADSHVYADGDGYRHSDIYGDSNSNSDSNSNARRRIVRGEQARVCPLSGGKQERETRWCVAVAVAVAVAYSALGEAPTLLRST